MVDDVFGLIKDASEHVEVPVYNTLRAWMPTYLQELELQRGAERGQLPPPRSYHAEPELDKFPENQLPAIVIVSPGMLGDAHRDGEGRWHAEFGVAVASVTSAKDYDRTRQLSKIYGACVMAVMLQKHPGARLIDISFDDLPEEEGRQLAAAVLSFAVWVQDLVDDSLGPIGPPDPETQPGSQWEVFETVTIDWLRKEDES